MANSFEVPEPILNAPFAEPAHHWYIREGEEPQKRGGRRPSIVYPPRDERKDKHVDWSLTDGTIHPSTDYSPGYELVLVNLLRERVAAWRKEVYVGGGNVTGTTLELMKWWRREGRQRPLFFAQIEAAETIIFLTEARADFLQGVNVPRDEPSDERKAEEFAGFLRYACKMATGTGKTTVMGMLAAWSILNKVHNRGDARFSDVVLVVCPNVTIRSRLAELDPKNGEASIYYTRDLVPPKLRKDLSKGTVLVMNWHVLEPHEVQSGGERARVNKAGREEIRTVPIRIGAKTTTARGSRYLTLDDFNRQVAAGLLNVVPGSEETDSQGNLVKSACQHSPVRRKRYGPDQSAAWPRHRQEAEHPRHE
jgi:type III restriction enzyme